MSRAWTWRCLAELLFYACCAFCALQWSMSGQVRAQGKEHTKDSSVRQQSLRRAAVQLHDDDASLPARVRRRGVVRVRVGRGRVGECFGAGPAKRSETTRRVARRKFFRIPSTPSTSSSGMRKIFLRATRRVASATQAWPCPSSRSRASCARRIHVGVLRRRLSANGRRPASARGCSALRFVAKDQLRVRGHAAITGLRASISVRLWLCVCAHACAIFAPLASSASARRRALVCIQRAASLGSACVWAASVGSLTRREPCVAFAFSVLRLVDGQGSACVWTASVCLRVLRVRPSHWTTSVSAAHAPHCELVGCDSIMVCCGHHHRIATSVQSLARAEIGHG